MAHWQGILGASTIRKINNLWGASHARAGSQRSCKRLGLSGIWRPARGTRAKGRSGSCISWINMYIELCGIYKCMYISFFRLPDSIMPAQGSQTTSIEQVQRVNASRRDVSTRFRVKNDI